MIAPTRVRIVAGIGLLTSASLLGLPAFAGTQTVGVSAEATIFEEQPSANAGGESSVCIGDLNSTAQTRQAFVRYTLPSVPAGSTITRVILGFVQERVRQSGGGPFAATLQLRRVTGGSWLEGTGPSVGGGGACAGGTDVSGIDWNNAPAVSGTPSGTEALPATPAVVSLDTDIGTDDDPLIDDLQSWVDGSPNDGWQLAVVEDLPNHSRLMTPGVMTAFWTIVNGGACGADGDCTSGNCVHLDGNDCGGRGSCVCCDAATCNGAGESCQEPGTIGTCTQGPPPDVPASTSRWLAVFGVSLIGVTWLARRRLLG